MGTSSKETYETQLDLKSNQMKASIPEANPEMDGKEKSGARRD